MIDGPAHDGPVSRNHPATELTPLKRFFLNIRTFVTAALLLNSAIGQTHSGRTADYVRDVKPILKTRCYSCHGSIRQEAELRLDTVDFMRVGGESGATLHKDDLLNSLLLNRVAATDESERMPPEGEPLSPEQIGRIKAWLAAGAPSPANEQPQANPQTHWAFQPLIRIVPPSTVHPIDAFVDRRLHAAGLHRSKTAQPVSVVRRMFLDLHGLLPTPEQIDRWTRRIAEQPTRGCADLINELLKSPRYGERWAQHWLDVVRYADTHGYEVNTPRPHAWPYRDYVILAFNDDKPYDRFVFEQLAGDTVGEDAATGFLVAAAALLPGQIGKDEASKRLARQDELDEVIVGTTATFLGLTVGCARCHDHKFDPIPQDDYYAFQAFFAGMDYGDREIHDRNYERRTAKAATLQPKITELQCQLDDDENSGNVNLAAVTVQLEELKKQQSELRTPQLVFAGRFRDPDATFVLNGGDPEQPTTEMTPHVLTAIASLQLPQESSDRERRTALANWIASAENPLTARVLVNRLWQSHFGIGLVETSSDFGLNSMPPSHPELLDWLAQELIDSNWSMKHLHRLIMSSETYRQESGWTTTVKGIDNQSVNPLTVDANNRLLWRSNNRRLEAEAIRDCMLQVSGQLNLTAGGPGFDFFKTRGGLSGFPPVVDFSASELRRMIYAHRIRMEPVPVFGAFDFPDAGLPTPRRSRSTTAIQALNLFNSPFVLDQSTAFANRVQTEFGESPERQVHRAFRLALGRLPSAAEEAFVVNVIREHDLATLCRALFNSSEFLFIP